MTSEQLEKFYDGFIRAQYMTDEEITRELADDSTKTQKQSIARAMTVHPAEDWREEYGAVLWWHFPVCEPPLVGHGPGAGECRADGTPTSCAHGIDSGWLTHWSHLPIVWDGNGQPLCVTSTGDVR